ncbi:MAG: hypothetical protein WAM78_22515 [Candidatus Sulfotelmatobacter sp.]
MRDYLQSFFDELGFEMSWLDKPWKPVSQLELGGWLVFYLAFMAYAFSAHGGFLFIDRANLVVHEGGHNLFGWFGRTLCLWGGTLLQWLVPFLLAVYFFTERQISGFVFCTFFFFENWLYTATYMADARAMVLPLVTTGDPEFAEHDFHAIFSSLGVLDYDTKIAAVVRLVGWCGMIAVVIWFARQEPDRKVSSPLQASDAEGARFQEFLSRESSRH